jgi:type II secretion system protein G
MKKGFTLMEILIVISILSILMMLVLANLKNQISKAQDAQRKTDLQKIQKAIEEYSNDNQTYPANNTMISHCGKGDLAPYLLKIPCDPVMKTPYVYIPNPVSAKEGYVLCAKLDNRADVDIARIGCNPTTGCGWAMGYNYCVASGMLPKN